MAVSAERLAQLREQFIPTKNKIDDIDRKYSLDYVEPKLDMPESLDLPRLEYTPKTQDQLNKLAEEKTEAAYLSDVNRINSNKTYAMLRLDKQLLSLEEKTRLKLAKLLSKLNSELHNVNVKITNAGMLFSTVAERAKAELRSEYESKVAQCNESADNNRNVIEYERAQLEQRYDGELNGCQAERAAQIKQAYNKLLTDEQDEQTRVEKYNTSLDEKEKKYLYNRAKAVEQIRQAEYDRAYKAKKLYQEMGAVGYEENILWEKYNVFVAHFANFTSREEALTLIKCDSYVQGHLKQYYSTLVDWVTRNLP